MYQNGIQSYRKTTVYTANPGKLIIMCYEGAIDNLKIAKQKFADEDFEGKCRAAERTAPGSSLRLTAPPDRRRYCSNASNAGASEAAW